MIRTSKLYCHISNKNKKDKLGRLVDVYREIVGDWVDTLWNQLDDKYNCPKFLSTKNYTKNNVSQRLIKCASTQACGMIKACTEQKRKLIWVIDKLKEENKDTSYLENKLNEIKISKPKITNNFKCEINSICADLKNKNNIWFLQLKSLGLINKFRLALKPHRQTLKWLKQGKILNSFLISKNKIELRFEVKNKLKKEGKILGLDQGINNVYVMSDGQFSQDDNHGWNLNKILAKLSKKKKGSKGFTKVQDHRKNHINWSINQLNLNNVKQINVEKVLNLRKGKNVSRYNSHWTYTLIISKLKRFCEEQKVFVNEQNSTYRSQRCNHCGLVRKNQRKGKIYSCECGYVNDSDLNASLNHEVNLPNLDSIRHLNLNKLGFYWNPNGLFDLDGKELTVPYTIKI